MVEKTYTPEKSIVRRTEAVDEIQVDEDGDLLMPTEQSGYVVQNMVEHCPIEDIDREHNCEVVYTDETRHVDRPSIKFELFQKPLIGEEEEKRVWVVSVVIFVEGSGQGAYCANHDTLEEAVEDLKRVMDYDNIRTELSFWDF